jgi:DNA repair exonuclease SbcCD ATPase subunit/DNA repair exonuclease SbcCD nuclease subunit
LTKRHEEYSEVFEKFYEEVKKTPSTTLIAILGDLFHNKSDLSPECVLSTKNFLFNCAELRPTILIAGNHDATLNNKNRLDSLTPVVSAINHPNLFYLKDNGLYAIGDVLFNNMSVFSDVTEYITYDKIPQNYKNEYRHHIALYHGPVNSALTDLGFYMVNKAMPVEIFDGHHVALLGDIHKKQDLQHYDNNLSKPAVHYPGSMIQQNHGESIDGHGFSLWDLFTKTYIHTNLPNDYGFFTVEINKGKLDTDLTNIPKKARVHVKCFDSVISEVKSIVADIKKSTLIDEISYGRVPSEDDSKQINTSDQINLSDVSDISYQNKLLTNFLKNNCQISDQSTIDSVLLINSKINSKIEKDSASRNIRWKPKKFEFSNMFSYGENNVIDFNKTKNVIGLFGPNACGKSSIFSALCFCIFDKFDRGYKAKDVLNVQKSSFHCKFNFEANGVDYYIERKGQSNRKGDVKVDVKFWKIVDDKVVDLNGEARRNTNDLIKEVVGTYEDFILTSLSVQTGKNVSSFIDMGQSERKDLLSQFIGLTIFDKLLEVASDESKNISVSLKQYKKEDLETRLLNFNNEHSSLNSVLNDENSQLGVLMTEKDKLNEDISTQMGYSKPVDVKFMSIDIKRINEEIELCATNVHRHQAETVKLQEKLLAGTAIIQELDSKIKELENKNIGNSYKVYENAKNNLSSLLRQLGLKKIEVDNKISRRESLKNQEFDPNCRFCSKRNVSSVNELNQLSTELEQYKIEVSNLLKNKNDAQLEVDGLTWVVDAQTQYLNLLKKRNEENDVVSKHNIKISSLSVEIQRNNSRAESLKRDLEEYNKQLESIKFNKTLQSKIDELKIKLKNLEFNINQKTKRLQEVNLKISSLNLQIQQLMDSIDNIKKLEKEYEYYSLYIKSVSRDGIPYMVIKNIVPEIEREVNNILNQIVEFHVKIETDGKNIIPYIVYEDKSWLIEMSSGFERFISSLAIRVSLTNISNLPRPNFLTIDEGWGTMDAENLSQVKILFQFLKTNFDFVIIISHLDSIKDSVDGLVEIVKEGGFSSVKYE